MMHTTWPDHRDCDREGNLGRERTGRIDKMDGGACR